MTIEEALREANAHGTVLNKKTAGFVFIGNFREVIPGRPCSFLRINRQTRGLEYMLREDGLRPYLFCQKVENADDLRWAINRDMLNFIGECAP